LILAAAIGAVLLIAQGSVPISVMAVALLLSVLAATQDGISSKVLLIASQAVAVFGVYRLAVVSIPSVWSVADAKGYAIGHVTQLLTGQELWIGKTFAGLDLLLLMFVFWILWLAATAPPRFGRAVFSAAAILAGHLCYLIALAFTPLLLAQLPVTTPEQTSWWANWLRAALPWNVLALGAAIQLAIAAAMIRWSRWTQVVTEEEVESFKPGPIVAGAAAAILAILLPTATSLFVDSYGSLSGKKIVIYKEGFLNWLKPVHGEYGRYSVGMYGMLPTYIESLGGKCVISPDLSARDLDDASALVLIYPDKTWADNQLQRIDSFVRNGGSLLVFGEHTVREADNGARFNDVLKPTAMRVRFDCAEWRVGGWLQSYEAMAHPTTVGIPDDRNQFGVVIGASLDARWPAQVILASPWGWSDEGDPGSSSAKMGNVRYDAGEKLGDIVLAAEQPLGEGKVVAFGDPSSITNGINVGAHVFTSRLFTYLAAGGSPQSVTRQGLGIAFAVALVLLLMIRGTPRRVLAVAGVLSISLIFCIAIGTRACEVIPKATKKSPNNLAYIDASHIEAYSEESWREDGVGGLALTLMRNGYLVLMLPEVTPERLSRAGLLVSVAPSREFTWDERRTIREFIEAGGIFICTVGYDASAPSRPLLADLGFHVGTKQPDNALTEPMPWGHFKSHYLPDHYVRFHAAWAVLGDNQPAEAVVPWRVSDNQTAHPIALGPGNVPVILVQQMGKGKAVVIGDTCFAMNKNLEHEGGEPFEGMRENADFWRWFIAWLTEQPPWTPPATPETPIGAGTDSGAPN
jgi:hypothetical protein